MIPVAHEQVLSLKPYVGGTSKIDGVAKVVKLSSNEGAFGMNPAVVRACRDKADLLFRYPDGASVELRNAIAKKHQLDCQKIVCGNGSDELIGLLCHAYLKENDEIIVTQFAFLMYGLYATTCGAKVVRVPEKNFKVDVQAVLKAITDKTRIVFIANPGNPTGTYLNRDELDQLCRGIPKNVLLVLDSAYAEFVTADDYNAGEEFVDKYDNVVMLRTFSKIYALGGVRLGWSYSSVEIADVLNRIRGPFNVNAMAQIAGVAALEDEIFVEKCRTHNQKWREKLAETLPKIGIDFIPTQANFILMLFPKEEGKTAEDANKTLLKNGIIVRAMNAYGLPDCLRVTIGTDEDMIAVLAVLTGLMRR